MEKSCKYDSETGPKSKKEHSLSTLPQLDSEPSDGSSTIKRLKSTKALQKWWRLVSGRSESYSKRMETRERLQKVHKITFTLSLLIRLVVVAYLAVIFFLVAEVMFSFDKNDMPINPANGGELERSVRRDLMKEHHSGYANIATCRCALTMKTGTLTVKQICIYSQ